MIEPQLNFVDSKTDDSAGQTGGGGPWLQVIRDLFPFRINSCELADGRISFRTFDTDPPVDMYIADVDGEMSRPLQHRRPTQSAQRDGQRPRQSARPCPA